MKIIKYWTWMKKNKNGYYPFLKVFIIIILKWLNY